MSFGGVLYLERGLRRASIGAHLAVLKESVELNLFRNYVIKSTIDEVGPSEPIEDIVLSFYRNHNIV